MKRITALIAFVFCVLILPLVIIACGREAAPTLVPPKPVTLELPLGLDPALV